MNIFTEFKQKLNEHIQNLFSQCEDFAVSDFTVEFPKNNNFGDLTTNVAMVYAPILKLKPREIAEKLVPLLMQDQLITSAEIAGPGFINITLKNDVWWDIIKIVLDQKKQYGSSNFGQQEKVNLEYVSVNPTGPMHVGHVRCAVYGDTLVNILKKIGFQVTKEYYINDAGKQVDVLAQSAYLRYLEASGEKEESDFTGLYPGEYLIQVGQDLFEMHELSLKNNPDKINIIKKFVLNKMLNLIKNDLKKIGIEHDVFTSEAKLREDGKISVAIDKLKQKDHIYRGVLEAPKGVKSEEWQDQKEVLLFRSTLWGDDQDRVIQKHDEDYTYFAADLAYIKDKIDRGYTRLITVLGQDHVGYVKRFNAAACAFGGEDVTSEIKLCQLVNFIQNGEPLKMSKRAGTYITAEDVTELVGKDVIRIMMLKQRHDMTMDFDIEEVQKQSKDNPVFYIQYAYTRIASILRNAEKLNPEAFNLFKEQKYDLSNITHGEEINLVKFLSLYPETILQAGTRAEPHRIVYYLNELAGHFHSLWNYGRDNPDLRFITDNVEQTASKLALLGALRYVIASGLELCNVEPLEEM